MAKHPVDVFFYGSYMNFDVLAEAEISPRPYQTAWLPNYRLVIAPLANLVKDVSSVAFGIVTQLNHDELERLYIGHARDKLGGTYLPEAVLAHTGTNLAMPALAYLAHDMEPARPEAGYVDRIARPALAYGFPGDYLKHIGSFKSSA